MRYAIDILIGLVALFAMFVSGICIGSRIMPAACDAPALFVPAPNPDSLPHHQ